MTKVDEAKIRREGFEISKEEARKILNFISFHDEEHNCIEAEIVVKLELLANKYRIEEVAE